MRKYRTNNRDVCIGWGHRAKFIFSDVSRYTDSRGREEWIKKEAKPEKETEKEREKVESCGKKTTNVVYASLAVMNWVHVILHRDRNKIMKMFVS